MAAQQEIDVTTRGGFIAGASSVASAVALQSGAIAAAPTQTSLVPTKLLMQRLIDGNARYVEGKLEHKSNLVERREALTTSQAPFAAVVSCADSRCPVELVFDQGVGDLFVTRVAGNFASNDILGSLEYAVEHLGTRLIVVLGHEGCGAVKAVYDAIAAGQTLPIHLDSIQAGLSDAVKPIVSAKGSVDEAMIANVKATAHLIATTDPIIRPAAEEGRVRVVGAQYRLDTGKVHLVSQGA